ncbi:MAG: YbaK/EbsC family protein [Ideonella sp.]|nr:YbaK/EbsC family protein [Ideonella sp.]
MTSTAPEFSHDGFDRVRQHLQARGHPYPAQWLTTPARTCQEAAEALGLQTGQIAKSVIFKRKSDGRAVLVVAAGDQRVDEKKVAALVGPIGRADADFVKTQTGFSIGGVSPVAHLHPPVTLLDDTLFRFSEVWAAAGHPNGVFRCSPADLLQLTGLAAAADVAQQPQTSSPRP